MIITIHIRQPLLLSLFYNIIINFPSIQCLFVYTSWHNFGLHVCKVVFDQAFSSLPLFTRFGCAFKQNLFISPLVLFKTIWMCIQAKPFPPSPCFVQDNLDVHSSKTLPPICSRYFGYAFKQNLLSLKNFVQNTKGLVVWVFIPPIYLRFAYTHSSYKFLPVVLAKYFARFRLGICSHGHEILVCIWVKKFPPCTPWGYY